MNSERKLDMNSETKIERALKKTLALAAVWLLVGAGSPAEAAKVLGLDFARPLDSADTSKIMIIDTATGTSVPVGDTGLTSSSTDGPNGVFGPNGLAYDTATGTAYYAAIPNAGATRTLYSMVIDPPPAEAPRLLGPLVGTAFNATFFDGQYWYVDSGKDDLRAVSFKADGTIDLDADKGDLKGNTAALGFGDISVSKDGLLYGSADLIGGPNSGEVVFFTVDLTAPDPVATYTELVIAPDSAQDQKLQLAFGGEGTLFGYASGNGNQNLLFYVSVVPGQMGGRAMVLREIHGGPFTDVSTFSPLCACPQACGPCDGGVVDLRLANNGPSGFIEVRQSNGDVVFGDVVEHGASFSFEGTGDHGKLGSWIKVDVGGEETKIHTSCSEPIGPGSTFGNFDVIAGTSKKNGLLCPIDDDDGDDDDDDDGGDD